MKSALTLILALTVNSALGMNLSFKDHVELKKMNTVSELPAEYIKLHRDFNYIEEKRMIAGKFHSVKKPSKKDYLDSLRSKLEGFKGQFRF